MKTICRFCKTEFTVAKGGANKCPACGHFSGIARTQKSGAKLFVVIALLIVACLFSVIAINIFNKNQKENLLTVSVSSVTNIEDGYIVRGNIRNFSEDTYLVPDLVFVIKTDGGIVLNQVSVLPPAGTIDGMSDMEFIKKIGPKVVGAKKISVDFAKGN